MRAYDKLSPELRRRMAESPYNLCAACVWDGMLEGLDGMEAIQRMEQLIREGAL
jgi:hypothetical protein